MNTVTDRLRSRQSSAVLSLSRLWCFRAIPYTGTSELCEETERWMINTGAYKSSRSWSVILTSLWWWWTFRGNSNNSRLFFSSWSNCLVRCWTCNSMLRSHGAIIRSASSKINKYFRQNYSQHPWRQRRENIVNASFPRGTFLKWLMATRCETRLKRMCA